MLLSNIIQLSQFINTEKGTRNYEILHCFSVFSLN